MSDYHILEQDIKKKGYTVAYHFPVPAGNNTAGRPWNTSLVEYKTRNGESLTSVVPNITDQADFNSGDKNEIVQFFRFSSANLTNAQKKSEIENGNTGQQGMSWNAIKTEKQAELSVILENWTNGFNIA